jgi:hypothetical protein
MSMYKGTKRFDKAQLEFIVEVMITSCIDTIEAYLPQTPSEAKTWPCAGWFPYMYQGCLESLGWNLSILYAQVSGDGMGTQDALAVVGLENHLDKFIKTRTSKNWKGFKVGEKICPIDTAKLAREFVKECFEKNPDDYLKLTPNLAVN